MLSKRKNRKRKRRHGFLARKRAKNGSVLKKRRRKGRKRLAV